MYEIRWSNILAAILALVAVVWAVNSRHEIAETLSLLRSISPGNRPEHQLQGVITLGLLCLTATCIVRLLTRNRDHD